MYGDQQNVFKSIVTAIKWFALVLLYIMFHSMGSFLILRFLASASHMYQMAWDVSHNIFFRTHTELSLSLMALFVSFSCVFSFLFCIF